MPIPDSGGELGSGPQPSGSRQVQRKGHPDLRLANVRLPAKKQLRKKKNTMLTFKHALTMSDDLITQTERPRGYCRTLEWAAKGMACAWNNLEGQTASACLRKELTDLITLFLRVYPTLRLYSVELIGLHTPFTNKPMELWLEPPLHKEAVGNLGLCKIPWARLDLQHVPVQPQTLK